MNSEKLDSNPNPLPTIVTTGCGSTTPVKLMPDLETGLYRDQIATNNQSPVSIPMLSRDSPQPESSSSIHGPPQKGHLPLIGTSSLGNGTTSRTTPILRGERQPKTMAEAKEGVTDTPKKNFKVNRKGRRHQQVLSALNRPCEHHSFLTDVTAVQQMEQLLVKLLDDFHSGKLQAFGKDCSFQRMDNVREQQERLARLHFDLGSQQENYGSLSEEGRTIAKDHLTKLMTQLQDLSLAMYPLKNTFGPKEGSKTSMHSQIP